MLLDIIIKLVPTYIRNSSVLIVMSLCDSGCSPAQKTDVCGHYISTSVTSWEAITFNVKSGVVGSTLQINEDSTFHLTTCSEVVYGSWKIKEDSIFLLVNSRKRRIDSTDMQKVTLVYGLENNELHRIILLKHLDKRILDRFTRMETKKGKGH